MRKGKFYNGKGGKWLFVLIVPLVLGLAGLAVMWLWNMILPELLGVKTINFWQSVGLFLLCRILFGNFKGNRGNREGRRFGGRLRERWANATPEEREAIKEELRKRCRR